MAKAFKPQKFGRYHLIEKIATGGMAEIFTAKLYGAMGFEKQLVIKRILPQYAEDGEFLQMFITEAKLVCHLEHPNIVQVHELGEIDGQYYIAMELVNGIDARQLWRTLAQRKQRLPGLLALFIVSEFLKGLDHAHRAIGPEGEMLGVVHRDVSPSNILISYRGDVKISDFGIALVHQESKTQAGVLKGKFGYMTPEQVAGMKVDHRSDIFSAGIVLAELLLGRRLFMGTSYFETLDKVLNVRLEVLDEHESALPAEVVKIVRRALRREVDARYQSAREFVDAIQEFLFERRARITNETLAAFISEHVSPYLVRPKEEKPGSVSVRSGSPSPISRPPVVPRTLPPGIDLAPRPVVLNESVHPREEQTSKNPVEANSLSTDLYPQIPPMVTAGPPSEGGGTESVPRAVVFPDGTEAHDLAEEQRTRTERPISPAPSQLAEHLATSQIVVDPEVLEVEQDSVVDETGLDKIQTDEYQFGAIPVFETDAEPRSPEALQVQRVPAQAGVPDGEAAATHSLFEGAAIEELDFHQWNEEDLNIAPAISQIEEPGVLGDGHSVAAQEVEPGSKPSASGKLSTRSLIQILFRFLIEKESGLLILNGPEATGKQAEVIEWLRHLEAWAGSETDLQKTDGRTCSLHLSSGQPHLASADRNEEAIVAFLIRTGILTEEKVEKAIQANPQRKPVAALLASGMLAPLQVLRHLTAFVLGTVVDAFSWPDGDFRFYRGKDSPSEAFPTGLDATGFIAKGVATLHEAMLDPYFRQLEGHRVFLNRMAPIKIDQFNPDPLITEAYRELGTSRTVEDTLAAFTRYGTKLAAKQTLYLFIECELALLTIGL